MNPDYFATTDDPSDWIDDASLENHHAYWEDRYDPGETGWEDYDAARAEESRKHAVDAMLTLFGRDASIYTKPGDSNVLFAVDAGEGKRRFFLHELLEGKEAVNQKLRSVAAQLEVPPDVVQRVIDADLSTPEAVNALVEEAARVRGLTSASKKTDALALSVADLNKFVFVEDREVEPDRPIFDRFIAHGDLVVWIGQEKHRKSNLILQFIVCAAIGKDFLGLRFVAAETVKIVLIDFETKTFSLKKRIDAIILALKLTDTEKRQLFQNLRIIEVKRVLQSGRVFPKFGSKDSTQDTEFWHQLVASYPGEIYVIDPLRPLHSGDENDSRIEALLSEMRRVFRGATVICAHHMRKADDKSGRADLEKDMRQWSDGARGSSAIKAHADVIVLQERTYSPSGDEVVKIGAFLKDGADIEPFSTIESDHNSFCFERVAIVPERLQPSFDALRKTGGKFSQSDAVQCVMRATRTSRATAYRHVEALVQIGVLARSADQLDQLVLTDGSRAGGRDS